MTSNRYAEIYSRSLRDAEGFWSEAAAAIHWDKPWNSVLDQSNQPFYRWFAGGEPNTCYNALDLHVKTGRRDQAALIHDNRIAFRVISSHIQAVGSIPWGESRFRRPESRKVLSGHWRATID